MNICTLIILLLLLPVSSLEAQEQTMAREVLKEINLARTDPGAYVGVLRSFRGLYNGKLYRRSGSKVAVRTSEGQKAVDEAIRYLSSKKPQPPLKWSEGLSAAARELVEEQGESGETGHRDRRGHGPKERVERQGNWEKSMAENIGYGPGEAREMVLLLIVDDGVPDRGHRKNIFNGSFSVAGIACGPHPRYETSCVIEFAGGFSP